ncbi:MAG TPA: hypothetical protein VGI82_07865 [Chitinophagaceae bacterium]
MTDIIQIDSKTSTTVLPCSTSGCQYHVEFDSTTPPIPSLVDTKKSLQTDVKGVIKVYLQCDNPASPHTNAYKIQVS